MGRTGRANESTTLPTMMSLIRKAPGFRTYCACVGCIIWHPVLRKAHVLLIRILV